MKILILLILAGCTQKYTSYDLIRKVDFNREAFERPITVMQVLPTGSDKLSICFNQWLFFSNAEKEKNASVPFIVRTLCPGKDFLLGTDMVDTWWTSLVFSRSCLDVVTKCAEMKQRQ